MQGDFAKPPEQRLNYKHSLDGLYRVSGLAPNSALQSAQIY